ncbi:P-loop ATPase, Sll1717 family [Nonomuraea bangladeshensis]|uniref:P-loop ATPase, Sll1717 family n=1 Tax=Nonomuraea bangladeshensis TaxID=404385 RepID=UPI0031D04B02
MERLFFGYSAQPEILRETLLNTAAQLSLHQDVTESLTWEDLQVDGRLIINEVEKAIDHCTIAVFDLTTMNHNVLFELGLAIGKGKRILLARDSQDKEAEKKWRDFALLTTTGYIGYTNSADLAGKIAAAITSSPSTLIDDLLGESPGSYDESRLLYVPSWKRDESSHMLDKTLKSYKKYKTEQLDLSEYGSAPLAWFAEQVHKSHASIFHFTPSRAYLADLWNPRLSLLAGLARGLGRSVVLVTERQEEVAIDYRDLAIRYSTAREVRKGVQTWIENIRPPDTRPASRVRKHLSVELEALRFGNHVAESDQTGLDRYFVETRDYKDVLEARAVIFSGRKGTGKTANMLQAAQTLRQDTRNLVCVIKPASYELDGLIDILQQLNPKHLEDYLIEGFWKYLIYTEIAIRAIDEAERLPAGIAIGSPMDELRTCIEDKHGGIEATFAVRLEILTESLKHWLEDDPNSGSVQEARKQINAALYGGALKELRRLIGSALGARERVALLIDNLDKAWEKGADLKLLSRLLLGLLSTIGRIADEFHREKGGKNRVQLSLTVFIRSDIFAYVREHAREPDKIAFSEIEWRDRDLLARVLEDRFFDVRQKGRPEDLWTTLFRGEIQGIDAKDYILSRVQPRPRDLVFFANAAVMRATNARHPFVTEEDILEAERSYSLFAYEALLVEGVAASLDLEPILFEFAGESSRLDRHEVRELLSTNAAGDSEIDHLLNVLRRHGFIGIETSEDVFDYYGTPGEMRRASVLARKLEKSLGRPARFEIHPAYRSYLEIRG